MSKVRQAAQTLLDAIGLKTAEFTAATTDIITSAGHGLVDGNKVVLTTTDTLPAGLATETVYFVNKIDANTFYLCTRSSLAATDRVDVTDTGTGTHTFTMHDVGNAINVEMYKHLLLTVNTDGGGDADMTVQFQGSAADDCPDFSAAQAVDNEWDFVQIVDLEDGSAIDGDVGFVVSGADDNRMYEVNVNHLKWFNAIITAWAEGEVTVRVRLSND
jgi:hypothetical protein